MAFQHSLTNTKARYGQVAITLHWLVALAVIGLYLLGLYIGSLSYYDPAYRTVPHWHKSIGLLLAFIMIFRICWRLLTPQPAPLAGHHYWEQVGAKLGHLALYVLLLAVLFSGYLISTADGRAINLFNWFALPALPTLMENQEDIAGEAHFILATLLICLAALHALAALKHHFIDKDTTLKRMLMTKEKK